MTENATPADRTRRPIRKYVTLFVVASLTLFVLMQFVRFVVPPLKIENPPADYTVPWDSARTQALWDTACGDCHSNETVWPWYSYVAPFGWLIARDVHEGRDHMNVSYDEIDVEEAIESILDEEMPPGIYLVIHRDAELDAQEQTDLVAGLRATYGSSVSSDNEQDDDD